MTVRNEVGGISTELSVVPVISTSAYASGDQLGDIQTIGSLSQVGKVIDAPCQDKFVLSYLMGLKIIDKAKQDAPMTIYFFHTLPTVASSDNAPLSIVDAQATKCIGFVKVAATDWKGPAEWSIAEVPFANVMKALRSQTEDGLIYAVAQIEGAATFGAVSDLEFKYLFSQDLGNGRNV